MLHSEHFVPQFAMCCRHSFFNRNPCPHTRHLNFLKKITTRIKTYVNFWKKKAMNSTITDNTYSGLQIVLCLWRSLWYGNLFPHLVQISFEQLILWFCAETSWQRRHRFDPHLFSCPVRNWILSNRLLHFEHCGFGHVLRCVSIDSITFPPSYIQVTYNIRWRFACMRFHRLYSFLVQVTYNIPRKFACMFIYGIFTPKAISDANLFECEEYWKYLSAVKFSFTDLNFFAVRYSIVFHEQVTGTMSSQKTRTA